MQGPPTASSPWPVELDRLERTVIKSARGSARRLSSDRGKGAVSEKRSGSGFSAFAPPRKAGARGDERETSVSARPRLRQRASEQGKGEALEFDLRRSPRTRPERSRVSGAESRSRFRSLSLFGLSCRPGGSEARTKPC